MNEKFKEVQEAYDILSDCTGEIVLYIPEEDIDYTKTFEFDTECNL